MGSGAESKSTVNITVKDNNDLAVTGVKVLLTNTIDSNKTYNSILTGSQGGCTISNVEYGTYKVTLPVIPEGYNASTFDDLIVDSESEVLTLSLVKT